MEFSMPSRRLVLIAALALSLVTPVLSLAESGRTAAALIKGDPQLATLAKALEAAGLSPGRILGLAAGRAGLA